jgi:hypothetical protein
MTYLPRLLARLPDRFQWLVHNIVGHPLSELLYQIGLGLWADYVHDFTIPADHKPGTGRG